MLIFQWFFEEKLISLAISKGIAIRYQFFFQPMTLITGLISSDTLFYNNFNFLGISGPFSLEVGIRLRRKVPWFYSDQDLFFFCQIKKILGQLFVCLFFIDLCATSWNIFLLSAFGAFSV